MATKDKNGRSERKEWMTESLPQSLWGQPQRPNPRDEKQERRRDTIDARIQKISILWRTIVICNFKSLKGIKKEKIYIYKGWIKNSVYEVFSHTSYIYI